MTIIKGQFVKNSKNKESRNKFQMGYESKQSSYLFLKKSG